MLGLDSGAPGRSAEPLVCICRISFHSHKSLLRPSSRLALALQSSGKKSAAASRGGEEVGCHLFHFKMSCAGFRRELWILELTWTSV